MRRATDIVEYKNLIEAGFKVKPDMMWNHTLRTDKPDPYLSDYCETVEKTSTMFICRAWSLTLLIESVPKFTACGWFAIKYNLRVKHYLAGYVDDEGVFNQVFGAFDLIGAIVDLLLWTLKNPDIVAEGKKYLEVGIFNQEAVFDMMAKIDAMPKCVYNPADRQEGTPFPDPLLISDKPQY